MVSLPGIGKADHSVIVYTAYRYLKKNIYIHVNTVYKYAYNHININASTKKMNI